MISKTWLAVGCVVLLVGVFLTAVLVPLSRSPTAERRQQQQCHFVYGLWDTKPLDPEFQRNIDLWQSQGWLTQLWNKAMVEELLHDTFPQYESLYHSLKRGAQKADLARYLIVMAQGGFYFDLDCQPLQSGLLLAELPTPLDRMYVFIETTITQKYANKMAQQHPIRKGQPEHLERLANYAFGAPKGDPSLQKVIDLAVQRCQQHPVIKPDYEVLFTTGPDVTSTALANDDRVKKWKHQKWFIHKCAHTWTDQADEV